MKESEDKKVVFLKASIITAQKHLQVQPQTQLDIRSFFYLLKVLNRLRKLDAPRGDFRVLSLMNNNTMLMKRFFLEFWLRIQTFKLRFTYSMIHFEYMLNVAFLWKLLLHDICAIQWLNIIPCNSFSLTVLHKTSMNCHHVFP